MVQTAVNWQEEVPALWPYLTRDERAEVEALLDGLFFPDPDLINSAYLPLLYDNTRTQIFYGGSGSGKSVFLAQRCILDMVSGGRNYLICRQVARTIRNSVFNEIKKAIAQFGLEARFRINQSDMVITSDNGYQILFVGLDDTEKIKSVTPAKGVITDIWIEEATETEYRAVKDLYKRQRGGDANTPKRMILSFNPIIQSHWIYTEYFVQMGWTDDQTRYEGDDLSILKTWYVHNRFLTESDVHDLENEGDAYYRTVYTFGNWGVLGNTIFTNWQVQDLAAMRPQFVNRRNGLDFGFSSDPAAIVCSHYDRKRKTIYIFDELYERGLTNDLLAQETGRLVGRDRVVCDSAEPKSIAELRRYGVNAVAAAKGRDSVLHGVQWLQQHTVVIDKLCVNTRNEFQQYKWAEDKYGNAIRQPVDHMNHIIDGLRYAYEQDSMANEANVSPHSVSRVTYA